MPFVLSGAIVLDQSGIDLVVPKGSVQGTIDAAVTTGEYAAMPATAIGGLGTFRLQAYRSPGGSAEEVQFFFEIPDPSFSGIDDLVRIYLDLNHDHSADDADREIQIRRNETFLIGGINTSGPPSGGTSPAGVELRVISSATGWKAEIRLEPSELGVNEIPSVFGLYIQVWDGLSSASFPSVAATNILNWANVGTRYPIDYVIVLDQSGSMLSQNKWVNAKRAANFFANTMSILTDGAFFDDRLGLVLFSWHCSGSDQTATAKPLASIGAFPAGNYVGTIPDPIWQFCTPIGRGLATAYSNLSATNAAVQKQRGVLLLSDGLQNRPRYDFTPSEAGYDACPAQTDWLACPPGTVSNVAVSTVAFGEGDWDVDTDLLSDIQTRYPGGFATTFTLSTNPDDLTQAFLTGLEDLYITNQIPVASPSSAFSLTSRDRRLIAVMSWATPADAQQIALELNAATVSCDQSATNTVVGFSICVKDDPGGGLWRAVKAGGGAFTVSPSRLFVLLDLRVRARFGVGPLIPETGRDLLLTADLKDRGQPVLHNPPSHPVDVRVQIETPTEAVGTFVVTHQPKTCALREPQLPPIEPRTPVRALMPAAPPTGAGSSDPDPPPLHAAITSLLDDCDRDGLERDVTGGLVMRDDGSQGDVTANDGIYTLRFTDADVAGTYVFTFRVTGVAADGEQFSRTARFARYVRVGVTPDATEFDSRVVQQSGNMIVQEYYIVPQDPHGGYLGPGKSHKVDFVLDRGPGSFLGGVIDYGNGYYARRLQYDRTQGEPVVTPVVYGRRLEGQIRPFEFGVFAGATRFDNALGLDDGPAFGLRLGYRIAPRFALEAEGAVTFTQDATGNSGNMIQAMGSVRFELKQGGRLRPFLMAGAGIALFRGFGANDEAAAIHTGSGVNLWLKPSFGVRADARVLRIEKVLGAVATTNYQATAGFVLRF